MLSHHIGTCLRYLSEKVGIDFHFKKELKILQSIFSSVFAFKNPTYTELPNDDCNCYRYLDTIHCQDSHQIIHPVTKLH